MDRPLLISADLIAPTFAGDKTETRRLRGLERINADPSKYQLKHLYVGGEDPAVAIFQDVEFHTNLTKIKCPYGGPGDHLWVRENWYVGKAWDDTKPVDISPGSNVKHGYIADGPKPEWAGRTRPSIHMPARLSRAKLLITQINVERVQHISEKSAHREGVKKCWEDKNGNFWLPDVASVKLVGDHGDFQTGFKCTWIMLNGVESWNLNPWVWVIKFKRVA